MPLCRVGEPSGEGRPDRRAHSDLNSDHEDIDGLALLICR